MALYDNVTGVFGSATLARALTTWIWRDGSLELPLELSWWVSSNGVTLDADSGAQFYVPPGFFHGYYDHYCFLPLYVFCGKQLLVSYLRPSDIDGAKHDWAILALLVKRLRQAWPKVRLLLRADSGFCRWKMLRWCERNDVDYLVGIARNERLNAQAQPFLSVAERIFQSTGRKQRRFHAMYYAAHSWDRHRRIIVKAEHTAQGSNPRYLVTNLKAEAKYLYDRLYCARGEMENRIKEQQLGLFADRTSAATLRANQLRLLLSAAAFAEYNSRTRLGEVDQMSRTIGQDAFGILYPEGDCTG